jgi:hypothetical protein
VSSGVNSGSPNRAIEAPISTQVTASGSVRGLAALSHAPNDAILPIMGILGIAGSLVLAFLKMLSFLPELPP